MQLIGEEQVSPPESMLLPNEKQWCGSGSAWKTYTDQLNQQLGDKLTLSFEDYLPHSASIVQLAAYEFTQGNAVEASQAQPVYLRNDVAKKSAEQKSVKKA